MMSFDMGSSIWGGGENYNIRAFDVGMRPRCIFIFTKHKNPSTTHIRRNNVGGVIFAENYCFYLFYMIREYYLEHFVEVFFLRIL